MIQWRPAVTPQPAQADPRAALSLQLERALAGPQYDINSVCQLGNAAYQAGLGAQAARAFELAIAILNELIQRGDAERALLTEVSIYQAFVKAIEDEGHYERVFALWREPMAALGRRFAEPIGAPREARGIGFVFPTGAVLGHTEVLFRLLEHREREVPVRIYVIGAVRPDFLARAAALDVAVEAFPQGESGTDGGYVGRLRWVRARMASQGVRTAVWVSAPPMAIFAFAMRLAPVQVMWSLRYHPVRLPEVDGYITYGSWGEESRVFHGQRWTVVPVPLALDPRTPDPADVAKLRARFPEKILLGTLAREEKIASPPFLEAVAAIMKRNPQCGYVWTGQAMHAGIVSSFQRHGIAPRCHFVGWVDTPLYAAILDVFLETFPLGCGITGYQAMGAGVPLVSYLDSNTVFGMQYWSGLMQRAGNREGVTRAILDEYPVLCALDGPDYVEIATRAVNDASFRDEWRARESRFYAEEIAGIARYTQRFFAAIADVAARKAA
jgi:hypothetical protein